MAKKSFTYYLTSKYFLFSDIILSYFARVGEAFLAQ